MRKTRDHNKALVCGQNANREENVLNNITERERDRFEMYAANTLHTSTL